MDNILEVENLRVWDERDGSVIVKDISFQVEKNRCLAIVGESGSGKSMTCKTLMGLHKPWIRHSGKIQLGGEDIGFLPQKKMRSLCGKQMCMIMQNGMTAFDGTCPIKVHFRETLKVHMGYDKKTSDRLMAEAMKALMLSEPEKMLEKYPHQLSGGMLQRCMIALALVLKPELLIADEPTTALDTITQYEVMRQFVSLKSELGNAIIFISHDLGVVREVADRILVMKDGEFIEEGEIKAVFQNPQHEYTKYLVSSKKEMSLGFRQIMEDAAPC